MIYSVDQLDIAEKRVFIRVDFNVPLTPEQKIADATRIQASLPTIQYLLEQGARLIIASHLGRPKGQVDSRFSLLPVAEYLSECLDTDVILPEQPMSEAVRRLAYELRPRGILLLENLRFDPGEESNDPQFSAHLAELAAVYVNDAFGTMHRAHASTVGMVPHMRERGAGFLVQKELQVLSAIRDTPERPFWAIIGGAKVADKIGLIEKLIDKVDGLLLGGGLAYTFLKAQGHAIGRSRLEEEKLHLAHRILERAKSKGVKILLPVDHRVAAEISLEASAEVTKDVDVPESQIGLDIGPRTVEQYAEALRDAGTIFWNGPLGYFENEAFAVGTRAIAAAVAASTAKTLIGGGDSALALKSMGLADQVTYISTGGGASLAFLEGQTLPGLRALEGETCD